jgi:hypothetical protein
VKKRYIVIVLEFVLIAAWQYAETKLDQRAVMFDASRRQLYDLLSCHAITAVVALPLFSLGYILAPRIPRFAASSFSIRVVTLFVAALVIYCLVWFALNGKVRPTI